MANVVLACTTAAEAAAAARAPAYLYQAFQVGTTGLKSNRGYFIQAFLFSMIYTGACIIGVHTNMAERT